MNSEIDKIKEIFLEAIENHSPDQWGDFLDQSCKGNDILRKNVQELLSGHVQGASLIDDRSIATIEEPPEPKSMGERIGPYKLREKIGEGGFGVVYVAEQKEPVSRKVALKVIKPGMDSKDIIARFEAERQALAMMDHPNVAKVLDAGATDSGRPYFVMELVQGVAVTEYCDSNKLTNRQRLELFIDVCHAVQHAHQKGIIHRDLKPTNIMVTMVDDRAVVKVIDFGVAKALHHDLTDKSIYTGYGQFVGTPMYMSPEQAQLSSVDIDTRSDIYSLGVLLYELLTGTTPFDKETFKQAGFDEVRRMIREVEPRRPSEQISTLKAEQISTISDCRNIDQGSLSKALRGDLDWIVMKTLEKDRTRRYETANSLADDVQRFLDDEPVVACPPSPVYRFRKFARRNKVSLAFTTTIGLFVLMGFVILAISNRMLKEQEEETSAALTRALEAERTSLGVQEFLIDELIGQLRSDTPNFDPDLTLSEATRRATERIENRFADQPLVEAAVLLAVTSSLVNDAGFEHYESALALIRRARDLRLKHLGPYHTDTLSAQARLGSLLVTCGNREQAYKLLEQTYRHCAGYLPQDDPAALATLKALGFYHYYGGEFVESKKYFEQASKLATTRFGKENPGCIKLLYSVADVNYFLGQTKLASTQFDQVCVLADRVLGESSVLAIKARSKLAIIASESSDIDRAVNLAEELNALLTAKWGSDSRLAHEMVLDNVQVLIAGGKLDEAERLLLKLEACTDVRRFDASDVHLRTVNSLGRVYRNKGDLGKRTVNYSVAVLSCRR